MSNSVDISFAKIDRLEKDGVTVKDSNFVVRIAVDEIAAEIWDFNNAEEATKDIMDYDKLSDMIHTNCSQDEIGCIMPTLQAREGFYFYGEFVSIYEEDEE